MTKYLLSIYQPDTEVPDAAAALPPEELERVMNDVDGWMEELKTSGSWLFNAGLTPPSSATVVKADGDDVLIIDGPYVEGKEHIGGFVIISADDLDVALEWGRGLSRATTLPIEVRPLSEGDQ